MEVIRARNVNGVWPAALHLMHEVGCMAESRVGRVLVAPMPVATVYERPTERVLFDPLRDANPFFHLHEALWMLAGWDDARWLDQFVSDFSSRFAEEGGRMHGAYGKRWRDHFVDHKSIRDYTVEAVDNPPPMLDQLDEVVRLLRSNPLDRQCVIQMWDPVYDLGIPGLKDRPCNTQIYLRADRTEQPYRDPPVTDQNSAEWESRVADGTLRHVLDMTVTCRSNDIVMGCYGANVVHFSFLQEYLAARTGYSVGTYTQMSNNWHMYMRDEHLTDLRIADETATRLENDYPPPRRLVDDPDTIDADIALYVSGMREAEAEHHFDELNNTFLSKVAWPMALAYRAWRARDYGLASERIYRIQAPDWQIACAHWMARRHAK